MKRLMTLLAIAALAITPATWAQAPEPTPEAEQVQAQGAEQSLTGCLVENEGSFMLRTSAGEIALDGDSLSAHAGKTIRVTGTMSQDGGKSMFKVNTAEVVSPSCQA